MAKKSEQLNAFEQAQSDEKNFQIFKDWVFSNFFYQANGQGVPVLYTFVDDNPKVISVSGAIQLIASFIRENGWKWNERLVANFITFDTYLHHVHDVQNIPSEDKLISVGRHLILNEWRPHLISNVKPSVKAPDRYAQFMEMIFPDEAERKHIETWFAIMSMRPHWQLRHGLILRSNVQGVGKDMLIERIIGECILGKNNFSGIALRDVTTNFNALLSGQRLVHIQELYRNNVEKSADALKPLITNERLRIEEKFKAAYMTDFYGCFVISSNERRPILLEQKDRRWYVPDDMPKPFADDQDKHDAFFSELYRGFHYEDDAEMLASYYEGICRSFQDDPEDVDQRHNYSFDAFSNMPPMTEAKKDLFKYDLRGEQFEHLKTWLDANKQYFAFRVDRLKEALSSRRTNVLLEQDIREALSSLGFNNKMMRVGENENQRYYVHPTYENSTAPKQRSEWSADKEPLQLVFSEY